MKISESMNTHQFYSIQEVMEIYEAMDTTYDQRYYKQQNILMDSLAKKLNVFQEQHYQINKQ